METFSWTRVIRPNLVGFRFLGLWPKGSTLYKANLYTLYSAVIIILLLSVHNLSQVLNIFVVYPDLQNLTETIFITVTNVLTLIKAYYFVKNMSTLKQLMVILESVEFQPRNSQQESLIQPDLTFWKRVSSALVVTVGSCLTAWCSTPLLNDKKQLPFASWYPFGTESSPKYELTYLHQVVSIWCFATTNLSLDTLISALMMFVGGQCDILCDNLRSLKVAPLSSEFCTIFFYLGAAIQEIFLYCWFGNEVQIKSAQIPYAVFESDWTNAPLSDQKNVLIFVMNTQKPIKMSAFNLFYLTLDTYIKILRVSWSYFAVLSTVNASE
ncbi:odorant receptor Or1-like [Tenebrio molitor]|uniref:odorant receptor Or1-like n=1 Tax=Tenebrio molitor TaxID=7067 RepID=UPI0036248C80